MAVESKTAKQATITKAAIHKLCEKGNQHNTERKPGFPLARSPEITQCKPDGQQDSQNWAIQKLVMAMPCSKWKGDTKHLKQSVKLSYGEKVTDASLLRLSGSSQIPLRCPFPVIGSCKTLLWCILLSKLNPMRSS